MNFTVCSSGLELDQGGLELATDAPGIAGTCYHAWLKMCIFKCISESHVFSLAGFILKAINISFSKGNTMALVSYCVCDCKIN